MDKKWSVPNAALVLSHLPMICSSPGNAEVIIQITSNTQRSPKPSTRITDHKLLIKTSLRQIHKGTAFGVATLKRPRDLQ